jgi:hypothetical protein
MIMKEILCFGSSVEVLIVVVLFNKICIIFSVDP